MGKFGTFFRRKSERVRSEGGLLFLGDMAAFGCEGTKGKDSFG